MKNLSEISITYNPKLKLSELPKITNSKEAETYFRSFWSNKLFHVEEMYLIALNRANKALGFTKISSGGTAGTMYPSTVPRVVV